MLLLVFGFLEGNAISLVLRYGAGAGAGGRDGTSIGSIVIQAFAWAAINAGWVIAVVITPHPNHLPLRAPAAGLPRKPWGEGGHSTQPVPGVRGSPGNLAR